MIIFTIFNIIYYTLVSGVLVVFTNSKFLIFGKFKADENLIVIKASFSSFMVQV